MYQLFRNKITESKLAFFILGFITSFAFAPYFIFPLVILFVFLILVINYNFYGRKKYFKIFALSIGHFVGCTYWVNHALLIDIWRHFWLTPFATLLLPAYMTLFPMLTILLTEKIIKNKPSILTIIGFSLAWVITEMLREMLLTGFPWNNLGYSLNFTLQTMQMAAVGGIYLNSFIVLMLGGFVFLFYHKRQKLYLFYTLLLLSVLYLTGENRLRNNITNFSEQKVRVVQGNIAQELKWEKEEKLANIYKYMRLSQHSKAAEIIVWPESAVAFSLNNNINILNLLSDIIPENGYLITGALMI
jgi:apolipoprotein N-acyltransferase